MTEDKFENPKPQPGESEKDFISRCIPYVKKEHPEWKDSKVQAVCYEYYRRKSDESQMERLGYKKFTDSAEMTIIHEEHEEPIENSENTQTVTNTKRMIAIVGDRFMNGGFFSKEELKKVYKQWEGTFHDINHEGTSGGLLGNKQDITKIIGYHNNVKYEDNNSVSMELVPHEGAKEYQAWKAFIEICEQAGQIPNVSVTYWGKQKLIKASELPEGVDYEAEGYNEDDMVPVLYNVIPYCVSTVLRGKCSDAGGCGIRNTVLEKHVVKSESCDCEKNTELDEEVEKKRQELIAQLRKDDNSEEK